MSEGSIARMLAQPYPHAPQAAPVIQRTKAAPVAPVQSAADAAKLAELLQEPEDDDALDPETEAAYRATLAAEPDGDWTTATARAVERLSLTRPDLANLFAAGHPPHEVLQGYHTPGTETADTSDVLSAIGSPTGLAHVALESTHSTLFEDDETDAEHDEAHVTRAKALLRLAAAELGGVQRETYSDRGPEPKS